MRRPNGYWTKERIFEEAHKYSTKKEFEKGCGSAYQYAWRNHFIQEMTWLVDGRVKLFTKKIDCIYRYFFKETNSIYVGRTIDKQTRDFDHRTKKKDTVLKYAKESGVEVPQMEIIEDNLTLEEGQKREGYWVEYYKQKGYKILNKTGTGAIGAINRGKWTKEKVFEVAKQYPTRSEFQKKCLGAYTKAYKNDWLKEMTWFGDMRKNKGYWSNDKIFDEARRYKTRSDFQINSRRAYELARQKNLLSQMTWFEDKKKPNGFWLNKENVYQEAKKYCTRTEFCRCCAGAYYIAKDNGWLDELFPKIKSAA